MHSSFSPTTKKTIYLSAFGVFLAAMVAIFWFVGRPMVEFFSEPERFRLWVEERGWWGRAAFVGMMILQVLVAIIPGEPLEIGAGYAFGFWEGTLLCLVGITLGSMLIFALVRLLGARLVEVFFPREKIDSLKFLQNTRRRNLILFLIFFIPGTPKDLLTYFVGLTKLRLLHWLLLCSVARLPSIVTSTIGGNALGTQDYLVALIVFGATLAISGLGVLGYRLLCRAMACRHAHRQQRSS